MITRALFWLGGASIECLVHRDASESEVGQPMYGAYTGSRQFSSKTSQFGVKCMPYRITSSPQTVKVTLSSLDVRS